MQNRKKNLSKNASAAITSPKSGRQSRKATSASVEKKDIDLITSSVKKQKSAVCTLKSKKSLCKADRKGSRPENDLGGSAKELTHLEGTSANDKEEGADQQCTRSSIFSPSYSSIDSNSDHVVKGQGHVDNSLSASHFVVDDYSINLDEANNTASQFEPSQQTNFSDSSCQDFDGLSSCAHPVHMESNCVNPLIVEDEFSALGNLSPEVSAIYYAMQNSNLECIDEQSQDSASTEECAEADESNEFDDFDPYVFIKDLPDLSLVVPRFRPVLLPKQTRSCPSTTLVLDLDETLVHSTLEPCGGADFTFPVNFNFKEHTIYVRCRPYLKIFLERVSRLFETIIFTASQSIYAEQLLNILDPKRKLFRHRVYRDSCVYVEGNYLKDLSVLGRDLARVIIVDNSPQAFGFQLENGVPIESWFEDPNDQELLLLLPFLESLAGLEDVRPIIARKFNLRAKVASAASFSIDLKE